MAFSRRALLSMLPAALLLPRPARAAGPEKRLLIVYVDGGWDTTFVFAPIFGSSAIDIDPQGTAATVGGIDFTDSAARPSVRSFFERYASRTCVLNGLEVPSVTHLRCRRLLFTGSTQDGIDDWPTRIANNTNAPLPYLVLSGPSFSGQSPLTAVRLGERGQLADLLSGDAITDRSDQRAEPMSTAVEQRIRQMMQERALEFAEGREGYSKKFADAWISLQDRVESLDQLQSKVDLAGAVAQPYSRITDRIGPALESLAAGYSRCALIRHGGQDDRSWDTHANNDNQSNHFETLFQDLNNLMPMLEQRTGQSGLPLSEEVVVLVVSEMARTPKMNSNDGKDHWTFTSAMFIGSHVAGGRMVGGYDDELIGLPTDPVSGEAGGSEPLTVQNFGATLLALMDEDPTPHTDAAVIEAILG